VLHIKNAAATFAKKISLLYRCVEFLIQSIFLRVYIPMVTVIWTDLERRSLRHREHWL